MGRPDRQRGAPQQGGTPVVGGVREDIRALNSSILLMTQKIKYIVRNEKILGRNLIVLNKKLKSLEEKTVSPLATKEGEVDSDGVKDLKKRLEMVEAQLADINSKLVTKEELTELKYIIDSINPLEFATLSQVKDMIERSKKN